jgi:hypothetical protein
MWMPALKHHLSVVHLPLRSVTCVSSRPALAKNELFLNSPFTEPESARRHRAPHVEMTWIAGASI